MLISTQPVCNQPVPVCISVTSIYMQSVCIQPARSEKTHDNCKMASNYIATCQYVAKYVDTADYASLLPQLATLLQP